MTTKRASTKAPAKTAAKKAAARSSARLKAIDAAVDRAKGEPGYPMVRALGKLAHLGPYPAYKKLGIR